jgi:hypothetical protein
MNLTLLKTLSERDKSSIINFWKSNFPAWPTEKYSWFYESNPYGKAACWVLKDNEKDTVIGSTAVFPRRFFVNGHSLMGGITGDFAVDQEYRIVGPALQLQRACISACEKGDFDFLYGYPNERSEPVQRRAGFTKIGSTCRMVKVLRSSEYFEKKIKSKIVGRRLGSLIDVTLRISSRDFYYRKRRDISIEISSDFDERVDRLWKQSLGRYPIIGERNRDFLNWRFTQCPSREYIVFSLISKNSGNMIGYVVYFSDKSHVYIVDFLVADMSEEFGVLLSEFLIFQKKRSIKTISIILFGSEDLMGRFRRFGFSVRRDERSILMFTRPDSPFVSHLSNKRNWYFTEGDND